MSIYAPPYPTTVDPKYRESKKGINAFNKYAKARIGKKYKVIYNDGLYAENVRVLKKVYPNGALLSEDDWLGMFLTKFNCKWDGNVLTIYRSLSHERLECGFIVPDWREREVIYWVKFID